MPDTYGYTPEGKLDGPKLQKLGAKYMDRIIASEKREDSWRKDAEAAEKAYANDTESQHGKLYDFNILHSNVETIVPAIFNSTPIPDVRRRFGDPNDTAAKQTGDLIERAIEVLIDDNTLDREIEAQAQDAFLSGRGIVRVRFDADWDGDDETATPREERILFEVVPWREFRMGAAKRWEDVGWVAFKHLIPEEECERITDQEILAAQKMDEDAPDLGEDDRDIAVWEIWDKDKRKMCFVRESDRKVLSIKDDPLGLKGFFPMAAPVQPLTLVGKLTPITPFVIYRRLADELDHTTKRIIKILGTLKVRGLTFGDAQDVQELAKAADGEIVVAQALEQLAQTKGLDGAISWWPLDPAIKALQQLYVNRDATRAAIYEITGISDIVRGASDSQETATAQQIKTQWGSLRIQKMQRMIERQVRDIFNLMSEIIAKHFTPDTLQRMTGIPVTPEMQALLDDMPSRHYRIDVESDSTIRADLTRARGEMAEFLTGTGNFFSAVGPVVQARPELQEPMAEVYTSFARQFRLGKQAEDALDRMGQASRQPQPEGPSPEEQARQAEMQIKAEELRWQRQEGTAKLQLEKERVNIEREKAGIEREAKQAELTMRASEMEQANRHKDEDRNAALKKDYLAAGVPPGYEFDADRDNVTEAIRKLEVNLAQAVNEIRDGQERTEASLAAAIKALATALTAPKRVVRDEAGKAVGVETVGADG